MSFWQTILNYFKGPDHDQELSTSISNVLNDSYIVNSWYRDILNDKHKSIVIKNATLPGDIEATTTISDYSDPVIEVDVFKVLQKHDRLEPVIGHEIFHVYSAYYLYGVQEFQQIVAREANLPWEERTVEKSAIEQEDIIRTQLIMHNPSRYKGMPLTRKDQNRRANACKCMS